MKIIKMPVAGLNADDLNTEAKNLLKKTADNVADFPAPPVTDLTAHQGDLNTKLGELATPPTKWMAAGTANTNRA